MYVDGRMLFSSIETSISTSRDNDSMENIRFNAMFRLFKIKFLLVILLFFSQPFSLFSQTIFEGLLPSFSEDTSQSGIDIIVDGDNLAFYLLGNSYFYDTTSTSGTPVGGTFTYGSTIIKVDSDGVKNWTKTYPTNCIDNCDGMQELSGRVPSPKIIFSDSGNIVLPFSIYQGLTVCDTTPDGGETSTTAFYNQFFISNQQNGNISQVSSYSQMPSTICRKDRIIDIANVNGNYNVIIEDTYNNSLSLCIYNYDLELNSRIVLDDSWITAIDNWTGNLIALRNDQITIYDLQGGIVANNFFDLGYEIYGESRVLFQCEDYLGFLITGKLTSTNENISAIAISDRSLDVVQLCVFENSRIVDAVFHENKILYLQNRRNNLQDNNPTPLNVGMLDFSMNIVGELEFGLPYVIGEKIVNYDQNKFGVVGTALTSILENEERKSDQIYLLLANVESLVSTSSEVSGNEIIVYPNPVEDIAKVEVKNEILGAVYNKFYLYDAKGRLIFSDSVDRAGYIDFEINMSSLPRGLYLLKIEKLGGQSFVKKIIKN